MTPLWIIAAAMIAAILLWAADTIALVRYTVSNRKRRSQAGRAPAKPGYNHVLRPGDCADKDAARCVH